VLVVHRAGVRVKTDSRGLSDLRHDQFLYPKSKLVAERFGAQAALRAVGIAWIVGGVADIVAADEEKLFQVGVAGMAIRLAALQVAHDVAQIPFRAIGIGQGVGIAGHAGCGLVLGRSLVPKPFILVQTLSY